jgi:hypothetical protein
MRNGEAIIPSHVTYAIFPTGEVEKDSAFPTYARLVAKKMDEQGFKETDAKTAKLAVYVGYGVTVILYLLTVIHVVSECSGLVRLSEGRGL